MSKETVSLPTKVRVEETGQVFDLPDKDIVTFGRLKRETDAQGNDIVLELEDPRKARMISRWHFQLHRRSDGYALKSVTGQKTEVDDVEILKDKEVFVMPGSIIRLSGILTLRLLGETATSRESDDDGLSTLRFADETKPKE